MLGKRGKIPCRAAESSTAQQPNRFLLGDVYGENGFRTGRAGKERGGESRINRESPGRNHVTRRFKKRASQESKKAGTLRPGYVRHSGLPGGREAALECRTLLNAIAGETCSSYQKKKSSRKFQLPGGGGVRKAEEKGESVRGTPGDQSRTRQPEVTK